MWWRTSSKGWRTICRIRPCSPPLLRWYADRQIKMIPEDLPEPRFANDSAVVRAVLTGHEKVLIAYAGRHELQWDAVSLLP